MSGRIIPTILGKQWRYPGIGPPPPCWSLEGPWNHPGLLGVSFTLLIEDSLRDQLVKNRPAMQETLIQFLGRKDLPEKRQAAHASVLGLPCGSAGKESACSAGDLGSIPGLGRSPGERNGLSAPVFLPGEFRGLYSPWGQKESGTTEQLSLTLRVEV